MYDIDKVEVPDGMVTPPDDIEKALRLDRTDEEVGDEQPMAVTFGDGEDAKEFDIVPARRVHARKFRRALKEMRPTAERLINMAAAAVADKGVENIQLAEIVDLILVAVGGELDTAFDMIYLYCPEMDADRAWIDDNGTDEQFAHALMAVFKVAFGPFGRVLGLNSLSLSQVLADGSNGQAEAPTKPTSATSSQDSGSDISESGESSPAKSTESLQTNSIT